MASTIFCARITHFGNGTTIDELSPITQSSTTIAACDSASITVCPFATSSRDWPLTDEPIRQITTKQQIV